MEYKTTSYMKQVFNGIKPLEDQFQVVESMTLDSTDPLREDNHKVCSCLVHRYPQKVLLLVTQDCAAHCAFCTRQRLCGIQYSKRDIDQALQYIQEHTEIMDVLISGGDPLTSPNRTQYCLSRLNQMDHVKWVRIGTRLPIVDPDKAIESIKTVLNGHENPKILYVNIHINHPAEITNKAKNAFKEFRKLGCILGSQSVILKGINDDPDTLKDLFIQILQSGVKPYYAYVTDRVKGTERFWVSPQRCIELFESLRGLPGLCIPKLVWDDAAGKIYLPEYQVRYDESGLYGEGFDGDIQWYPNE